MARRSTAPTRFRRVLFVAHREEILRRRCGPSDAIRPDAALAATPAARRLPDADVLFASIQTLSRLTTSTVRRRHFDYIVVDEFHHAAARTYRRLIDYFEPKFLLGPDRDTGAHGRRRPAGAVRREPGLPLRPDGGHPRGPALPVPLLRRARRGGLHEHPVAQSRFDEEALTEAVATHVAGPERPRAVSRARRQADARVLRVAAPCRLHGGVLHRARACGRRPSTAALRPHPGRRRSSARSRRTGHRLRGGHVQRGRGRADPRHRDDAAAHGVADPLAAAVRTRSAEGDRTRPTSTSSTTSATTARSCSSRRPCSASAASGAGYWPALEQLRAGDSNCRPAAR